MGQKARIWLELRLMLSGVKVEQLDHMSLSSPVEFRVRPYYVDEYYLRCEDGRMFVHTERSQSICCGLDCLYAFIHPDIPQFHVSKFRAAHEFALATPLQVNVRDPLLVLFPHLDHGGSRFLTLIIHTYSAITKTGNENVAFDLV